MAGGRVFTYEEALALFPEVRALTEQAIRQAEALFAPLQTPQEVELRKEELESAYQAIVDRWAEAVTALGCEVKGLWLVDWDSGAGYFCWKYPEESLSHFHGYEEGFAGRVPVT
jgi:hypothetical protein